MFKVITIFVMIDVDINIMFDGFKLYSISYLKDQWEFNLLVDGVLLSSLDGIPELSISTQLVLHVWNKDNEIPALHNPFEPPNAQAYFRNLR